jgi:hypothetical protein
MALETQVFVPPMKPFRFNGFWRRFSKAKIVSQKVLDTIRTFLKKHHPNLSEGFEKNWGKIFGAFRKHADQHSAHVATRRDTACKVLGCGYNRRQSRSSRSDRKSRRGKQLFCRSHAGYQSIDRELFDKLASTSDLYLVIS